MQATPQILHQQGNEALLVYSKFAEDWLAPGDLDFFLLKEKIMLHQNKITVFGKEYNEPRLTQWMGPRYRYSNIQWPQQDFSPTLANWRNHLSDLLHFSFNSVLINYYRDGSDSMGKHRDNEPEMNTACIASLTFGAARPIHFEEPVTGKKIKYVLEHGDLLVMHHLQEKWWHQLPKRKNISQARLNLTFRHCLLKANQ
jgi:alkylated DNA repair dioxygenase AlkB